MQKIHVPQTRTTCGDGSKSKDIALDAVCASLLGRAGGGGPACRWLGVSRGSRARGRGTQHTHITSQERTIRYRCELVRVTLGGVPGHGSFFNPALPILYTTHTTATLALSTCTCTFHIHSHTCNILASFPAPLSLFPPSPFAPLAAPTPPSPLAPIVRRFGLIIAVRIRRGMAMQARHG